MPSLSDLLERECHTVDLEPNSFERLIRRRDRKRRNQRIAAGVVGLAVFLAVALILGTVGLSDRTQGPDGGSETGPAETGPAEAGPAETGPSEAIGPIPKTDYLLDLDTGRMTPLPERIVGAGPGVTGEYAVSPDGSKLAYARPGDNGERQVFVANVDGTGIEQVTNEDQAMLPEWSPDGSKIAYVAYVGDDMNIFVLDLSTGSSTQVTSYTWPTHPVRVAFSADGGSVLYNAYDEELAPSARGGWIGIWMVPAVGGESVRVSHDGYGAQFSPDGLILSYSGACEGREIAICFANADGSEARAVARCRFRCDYAMWSPDGTRIAFSSEWGGHYKVSVMAVATGEATDVTRGAEPVWLDDHTLIVECLGVHEPNHACSG